MLIQVDIGNPTNGFRTKVCVSVFQTANPIVGERMLNATAYGPAGKGLALVDTKSARLHIGIGKRNAARCEYESPIYGIADAKACASLPVAAHIDVAKPEIVGVLVPNMVNVDFDATNEVVVHLRVVASTHTNQAAIEVFVGRSTQP